MSDPVTNVEIEDVLSSIRRLVSEDARAKPARAPEAAQDRLVLTPALRVDPTDVPAHPAPQAESEEAETGPQTTGLDGPVLLTDPAMPDGPAPEVVADDTDTTPQPLVLVQPAFEPQTGTEAVETVEPELPESKVEPDPESEVEPQPEDDAASVMTTRSILSKLVEEELDRAVQEIDSDDDDHTDSDSADAVAEDADDNDGALTAFEPSQDVAPLEDEDTAPIDPEPEATQPEPDMADLDGVTAEETPPETLESKIAALEQLVGQSKDSDWEGEEALNGGNAAFVHRPVQGVIDWEDHSEDDVIPDIRTEPATAAPVADWYADQPAAIDEDMLRDMVAEIVRQELQGALGERITRNVRKLVRREIHRVLMSQEFD